MGDTLTYDKRNNCFFFALRMWLKYGGYLVIRPSLKGFIPHFLWLPYDKGENLIQYKPIKRKKGLMKYIDKLYFKGRVAEGDMEYIDKMEGGDSWKTD